MELLVSIPGQWDVWFDEERARFPNTSLMSISMDLVQTAWNLATFGNEGDKGLVIIPDYGPMLRLQLKRDHFLIQLTGGMMEAFSVESRVDETIREIGRFHKALTEQLLTENPHLKTRFTFKYVFPGSGYLAPDDLAPDFEGQC